MTLLRGLIILICITFGLERVVFARGDLVPGSRYTSARSAALGDTMVLLSEDVSAGLFYNPADLGKIRSAEIEPLNFSFYSNQEMGSIGGALFPNFGFRGFSFGVLMQSETGSQSSLSQVIPAVGTGFRLLKGAFRFGYSLQWVNQSSEITAGTTGGTSGSGFSHMLGVTLMAPITWLPSLNFVVRNALNTTFGSSPLFSSASGASSVSPTELMSFDAALSVHPRLSPGINMNAMVEDRDLSGISGVSLLGRLAFGAEISFSDKIFLRGGYRGNYPSGGLGLRKRGAEMCVTWYSEEVGTVGASQSDYRLMIQYQFRNF